jgi:hypothetical protein
MIQGVTYTTKNMTRWNENRRGEIEFDALTRVYLGDSEIADRNRIAFALRVLRRRGYAIEDPVDWTKPQMICSLSDSQAQAFGVPVKSRVHRRLERIAARNGVLEENGVLKDHAAFLIMLNELYNDALLYDADYCDVLEEPYEFDFKGDPALVEAVFQAVGLATRLGLRVSNDGSETNHVIKVAPPWMVLP